MSETLQLEESAVQEEYFERGWTDGLPIVPPTPERVQAFLAAARLDPDEVLGAVAARSRSISAQETAINAVMAGCRPEYFPIVVAGVRALADPAYNANGALTSTGGTAICTIVSGPLAAQVGMNSAHNVLGQGNRANATIGRALRLVAQNVLGAKPGALDGASIGNPGKYSLCFAEAEPISPWGPLRVELGFAPQDTTVTILATEGPRQIANVLTGDPEAVLRIAASSLRAAHTYIAGKGGQAVVLLGPEHAGAVRDAGWTRAQAREYLVQQTRVTAEELAAGGQPLESTGAHTMVAEADGRYSTFRDPDDILLVCAGGAGAGWSAVIPAWAPKNNSLSVTRRVEV
ncbi:hypothetical protein FSW04_06460 [Baekduia soli]|uniref:Thioredoxin n=1 Tax=Baekduia soli TaxID=496014 RepID=A0A5B8U2M4_9ACTN|nr:hypothetical protein [Baekduia soli]QEC47264.1 hypothetical protein FSW04_06460 [Baekduia soli]